MRLEGDKEKQKAYASDEPDSEILQNLECQTLIKSIGYKSLQISDDIPFDSRRNVIPHRFGCVHDPLTDKINVGLYVAGWIKRGPVGIIDATLRDSMETFRMIKNHLEHDLLPERQITIDQVKDLLSGEQQIVEKSGWW